MKQTIYTILSLVMFLLSGGCSNDNENNKETVAPVSNVTYEPGNGTILFNWDNPTTVGLSYTEISYVNDDGNERRVLTDGHLSQQLIRGFSSGKSYEFKFITYNLAGEKSEPITFFANPREPLMNIFNGKVKMFVDFGGVQLDWDNIYDEDFYIDMEYSDINGNNYKEEILAPAKTVGSQFVPVASKSEGTQTIDITTFVSDIYGNRSVPNIIKFYKLEAGKFNRKLWTIVDRSSQTNGGANAAEVILDGLGSTFWENEWSSGTHTFPHHFTFDLGSKKRIEKAELQHRPSSKIEAKGIELYGSNLYDVDHKEATVWVYCGGFEMDQDNRDPQMFMLPNPVEYRYIKLVLSTPGKDDSKNGAIAEFALYGQDLAQ